MPFNVLIPAPFFRRYTGSPATCQARDASNTRLLRSGDLRFRPSHTRVSRIRTRLRGTRRIFRSAWRRVA